MNKKLLGNVVSLGLVQAVSYLFPLILLPYLARVLGVEQLGRMAFALGGAQLLVILSDYGFNLSGPRAIAVHRDNPQKIVEIFCAVTCIRACIALGGLVILGSSAAIFQSIRPELGLMMAAYIMVIGNIIFPLWLFQGMEQLKLVSAIQIVARFFSCIASFFIVKDSSDIYWATFLQSSGAMLGGLLCMPRTLALLDGGRIQWPSWRELRLQMKEGWHVFISTAAINIYTSCNAFFLGLCVDTAALGVFHVAERLVKAAQAIYGPVSTAIYPHVSRLANESIDELLKFNHKLFLLFNLTAFSLSLFLLFFSPFLIQFMFGENYAAATPILKIFALLPIIVVSSNIFGIQTMLPLGMEKSFSKILVLAAFINIAIFLPAAYYFGIHGAAWANVAIELFVTISMAVKLHQSNFLFLVKMARK